jgi:hypothetical protein
VRGMGIKTAEVLWRKGWTASRTWNGVREAKGVSRRWGGVATRGAVWCREGCGTQGRGMGLPRCEASLSRLRLGVAQGCCDVRERMDVEDGTWSLVGHGGGEGLAGGAAGGE